MCWLSIQHFILLIVSCLEPPRQVLVDSSLPCDLIGNFISTSPRTSGDPEESHRMMGGNVIQCLLALLHQWRYCFGSLKSLHSHLTMRTNTNICFWSVIHLNFVSTFCILHQCIFYFEMYRMYIKLLCKSHTSSFYFL
jgi:hypothetical protein